MCERMQIESNSRLHRFRQFAANNRITFEFQSESLTDEIENLQGAINAHIFANALDWMLPDWVHRMKRDLRGRIPTEAMNNTSHRNWIVLGGIASNAYAISDTKGLVTAITDCGSIDFWLKVNDEILFPTLVDPKESRLSMVSPEDQLYQWNAAVGSVEFSRLIYHVKNGECEYLYNEVVLQNLSLEETEFTFYVVLRPLTQLGVEPIENITYSDGRLFSNGILSVISDQSPSQVILSTGDNPNFIANILSSGQRIDTDFKTPRMNATGALRFDIKLEPAGKKRLFFALPLSKIFKNEETKPTFSTSMRESSVSSWFEFSGESIAGIYPQKEITEAMARNIASILIQVRSYLKGEASVENKIRVLYTLSRIHCHDCLETVLDNYFSGLTLSEFELKDIAALSWGIIRIHTLCKYGSTLKSTLECLDVLLSKADDGIESLLMEKKDVTGPSLPIEEGLPKVEDSGITESHVDKSYRLDAEESVFDKTAESHESEEDFEKSIKEIVDRIPPEPKYKTKVTLRELTNILWIHSAFQIAITDLDLDQSMRDILSQHLTKITAFLEGMEILEEAALFRDMTNAIDYVSAISLTRPNGKLKNIAEIIVRKIFESHLFKGLIKDPRNSDFYSGYISLRLAQVFVELNERDLAEVTLEKSIEYLSEFYTFPEFINPRTGGGSYGNGCSIIASTDFVLLLLKMMLLEDNKNIIVFQGIPEDWLTTEKPLRVEGLRTSLSTIGLEIGASANQYQVELIMDSLPEEIEIYIPSHFPLHMIKVFGGATVAKNSEPHPHLRIVPLANIVVLAYHR